MEPMKQSQQPHHCIFSNGAFIQWQFAKLAKSGNDIVIINAVYSVMRGMMQEGYHWKGGELLFTLICATQKILKSIYIRTTGL